MLRVVLADSDLLRAILRSGAPKLLHVSVTYVHLRLRVGRTFGVLSMQAEPGLPDGFFSNQKSQYG
jgi:hypothetical protein